MIKRTGWQKQETNIPDHMFKKGKIFQPDQAALNKAKSEFYEKEGDLKKLCYDYLLALPMSHPIDTPNFPMRRRTVKQKGIADLHCCLYGLYLAIETKIGKNGQSDEQKDYQNDIESNGGIYLLIYKFNDLVNHIYSIQLNIEKLQLHFCKPVQNLGN